MMNPSQPDAAGQIRSLFLQGPAGKLEALLNTGSPEARFAALVCHPHPKYGGTMHNKVVYNAAKALHGFGFPVLRFNFRGVGLSEGIYDHGLGERDDVRVALDWLHAEHNLPIVFAGFSFGSIVGLPAACPHPEVKALIGVGMPLRTERRTYDYSCVYTCTKPKLFVSSDNDEYAPVEDLHRIADAAAEPKRLVLVHGGDHFFEGHLPQMRAVIESWVSETLL